MANAQPESELQIQYWDDDLVDNDSEEEDEANGEAGSSKQNGTVSKQTDRYGFIGGEQYTDPEGWDGFPSFNFIPFKLSQLYMILTSDKKTLKRRLKLVLVRIAYMYTTVYSHKQFSRVISTCQTSK